MVNQSLNVTRNLFIDFFVRNNHLHKKYSSLVPYKDNSLMFVNSGMVQFKNIFTQKVSEEYKKVVTYQKCVRAGGKHNDLDNVGYTARHHTFFEMLGNFSFGQYFKEQAIYYSWEFLTKILGFNPKKLIVTVFDNDDESFTIWKKITGFSDDKIIRLKDNFWSMAKTGPCGPCSEVFFDHGDHIPGGMPGTIDEDGDRYVEIWNMVFMQFNQLENGEKEVLSMKSVDTGMGLERINAVLNGVVDNYDIPFFSSAINIICDVAGIKPSKKDIHSFKIIADHLRATSFIIADGITPGNESRGYVLRRIMRRMLIHSKKISNSSNSNNNLFEPLIEYIVENMKLAYPELEQAKANIISVVNSETEQFSNTLNKGMKIISSKITDSSNSVLSGIDAFTMHDTYGFPIEATLDFAKEKNFNVDLKGFYKCMEEQKNLSREHYNQKAILSASNLLEDLIDGFHHTIFLGYDNNSCQSVVQALIYQENRVKEFNILSSENKQNIFLLISKESTFFAEAGGQIGDTGEIIANNNSIVRVIDTQKSKNDVFIHKCILLSGSVKEGQEIHMRIDEKRRHKITLNHSAAHILYGCLRKLLGEKLVQQGFSASEDKLKLDFSCPSALRKEDLNTLEEMVNSIIMSCITVIKKDMQFDQAIQNGFMTVPDEQYGDVVRVVEISSKDIVFSKELCCGTHVSNTGLIGSFKIISEKSIKSGTRRIEAFTGLNALKFNQENHTLCNQVAAKLNVAKADLWDRLNNLMVEIKDTSSNLKRLQLDQLKLTDSDIKNIHNTKHCNLIFKKLNTAYLDKKLTSQVIIQSTNIPGIDCVIFAEDNKKYYSLTLAFSKSYAKSFSAKDILDKICEGKSDIIKGQNLLAATTIKKIHFDLNQILNQALSLFNK